MSKSKRNRVLRNSHNEFSIGTTWEYASIHLHPHKEYWRIFINEHGKGVYCAGGSTILVNLLPLFIYQLEKLAIIARKRTRKQTFLITRMYQWYCYTAERSRV